MTDDAPAGSTVGFGPCYRHPKRDSGVRCARCERPICPDCMISAPVGFQCPSCVKGEGTRVLTMASLHAVRRPLITLILVAVNVAAFLPSLVTSPTAVGGSGNTLAQDFALYGPAVAGGEWWRLVTSGFLHYGFMHLAFNMLALWILGSSLEPALGKIRFTILYFAGMLAGSAGALWLSYDALTAGASGAVFGLMAALFVGQRRVGLDPWKSGVGGLLVINLLFTFLAPGLSIGGHLGGLAGGAVVGTLAFATIRR